MAHPCCGWSARILSNSRSRVPWTRSAGRLTISSRLPSGAYDTFHSVSKGKVLDGADADVLGQHRDRIAAHLRCVLVRDEAGEAERGDLLHHVAIVQLLRLVDVVAA